MLVGRTAIGERVWCISRLIAWALKNEAVNPERIAITGNSGGGTLSIFAPACDTRISVVLPASYFCTFADSIGVIHHCELYEGDGGRRYYRDGAWPFVRKHFGSN